MPIYKKLIDNNKNKLYLWFLSEDIASLQSSFKNVYSENTKLPNFKAESRLKEWIVVRLLASQMIGKVAEISYEVQGCPVLDNSDYHISISHSKYYLAIYLSKEGKVGIDIEELEPKILRISSKFMNEFEFMNSDESLLYVHKLWCSKEVLFKLYSRGGVDFKRDLQVEVKADSILARIDRQDMKATYALENVLIDKLLVVYNLHQ